jgi:hypothetical protein
MAAIKLDGIRGSLAATVSSNRTALSSALVASAGVGLAALAYVVLSGGRKKSMVDAPGLFSINADLAVDVREISNQRTCTRPPEPRQKQIERAHTTS